MAADNPPSNQPGVQESSIGTTRWSIVLAAANASPAQARIALESLCRTYWTPLYVFLRRCGCPQAEAEDVVQGFFTRLLEKKDLRSVTPERGRFRSFLLAAIKHHWFNQRDRDRAAKRGGGHVIGAVDWDGIEVDYAAQASHARTPDADFDRQWALTLLHRARESLRSEYQASGKGKRFDVLIPFLGGEDVPSCREVAVRLEMTENAVQVAIHRLRQRFRQLLRAEIAQTVLSEADIDEEIRDLFQALRK